MASRPEDDLTCPTCMGIYNNPVLLSCGHSSCHSCLQRWWKEKRSQDCPVCREKCSSSNPPRNLALKNLCEAFLLEQEQKSDPEELREKLKALKLKLDYLQDVKDGYDKLSEHVKTQVKTTERHIKKQFKIMHKFLEEDEEARIADLRDDEERMSQKLKALVEKVSREMAALSEIIRTAEEALNQEDALWQKHETALDKAMQQQTIPCDFREEGSLINVAKHVGNLSYKIWCKMSDVVKYYPIVLDPNTAGNLLSLSEDLTAFKEGDIQKLPETRDRLSFLSVLASEGYESGQHSWEVYVGDSKCWGVGVIEKRSPGEAVQEGDSWRLVNGFFGLMALGPDYEGVAIPGLREHGVTKVRLELDCGGGSLTLLDLDSNSYIHVFRQRFRGKVFPYFYNWDQQEIKIIPKALHINMFGAPCKNEG